ncbi:MAG: sulfite exporter TauE/SafE family protein [Candidatus Nitrotoga sp.]
MEWALIYLLLGAIAGLFGGMFGIGGGTLLVPVLFLLFEKQGLHNAHLLHLALGTSMAIIIFTALASMRKHHHHHAVNWRVVRLITPGILLGTLLGALFATSIALRPLAIFFACFVLLAALQILFNIRPQATRQLPGITGLTLVGAFTGWLSSLVSIGGGTIMVPFLLWCNVSLRKAIGTSAAIGFPVAVGGTMGYVIAGFGAENLPPLSLGFVYWPALMWVALASVFTAPLGAKMTHQMEIALLRKLFAILLIVLAGKLLTKIFAVTS